ncbi:Methyl-accepting chemotaxis protein [Olavius algarvensis Delta 1 endosymbiont]|nr:Methyl-accepting chemotaxis protein [Olavius algarvensis Delta 1 endosymbiont]
MTTDLFFSQPVFPNPPAGIQSSSLGPSGLNQSSKIQTPSESPEGDQDNFLTTLQAASGKGTPEKLPPREPDAPPLEATASVVVDELDDKTDPAIIPGDASQPTETDSEPIQIPSDWNGAGLVKVLEALGLLQIPSDWNGAGVVKALETLGVLDAIDDSGIQQMAHSRPADIDPLAAIELLTDRLLQNKSGLTSDPQVGIGRLRQFMANVRDGKIPLALDEASRQGLISFQSSEPGPESAARSFYRSVFSAQPVSNLSKGQAAADGKLPGVTPAAGGDVMLSAGNTTALSQLSRQSNGAPNLPGDKGPASIFNSQELRLKNDSDATSNGISAAKAIPGPNPDRQINQRADTVARVAPPHDQAPPPENASDNQSQKPNPSSAAIISDRQSQNQEPAFGKVQAIAKFFENPAQGPASEQLFSRIFQETPSAKEGVAKVESVFFEDNLSKVVKSEDHLSKVVKFEDNLSKVVKSEDHLSKVVKFEDNFSKVVKSEDHLSKVVKFEDNLSKVVKFEDNLSKVVKFEDNLSKGVKFEDNLSKVVKIDAGANDNSLLNSSGQSSEKPAEAVAGKKEADAGQSDFRTQTMDQIVRKAAIHLRNGQHEARIELKPDFLGHVRMQVISENQQVTIKILAEHGFVKEMIEGNLHQLKADLQHQGLEVDKLEVTVSRDPEDSANHKYKLAQPKFRQGSENQRNEDHPQEEPSERPRRSILNEDKSSAVDFFA